MKTPQQKKNEQVDILIKFILIMILIIFGGFIVTKCDAKTTGYHVWIKDKQGTISQKFTDVNKAQSLISSKTELIYINNVLANSVFYEQRNQYFHIYIEKLKVKYKKNGKIKYKRIKI